jgi:hypothetical protein
VGRADLAKSHEFQSLQERWTQLLTCYRKQDWTGALGMADVCRRDSERFDLGGLVDSYVDRIRQLQQVPPASDWDGVFTAETK